MVIAGTWDRSKDCVCWKRCSSNSCASEMPHSTERVHNRLFSASSLAWISKGGREPNSFPEWDLCSWMPLGIQTTESQQISVTKDILSCAWHPVPFTVPLCALLWGNTVALLQKWERQGLKQFSDRPYPTMYLQGQGFRWGVTEQWLQTTLFQRFFRSSGFGGILQVMQPHLHANLRQPAAAPGLMWKARFMEVWVKHATVQLPWHTNMNATPTTVEQVAIII